MSGVQWIRIPRKADFQSCVVVMHPRDRGVPYLTADFALPVDPKIGLTLPWRGDEGGAPQ